MIRQALDRHTGAASPAPLPSSALADPRSTSSWRHWGREDWLPGRGACPQRRYEPEPPWLRGFSFWSSRGFRYILATRKSRSPHKKGHPGATPGWPFAFCRYGVRLSPAKLLPPQARQSNQPASQEEKRARFGDRTRGVYLHAHNLGEYRTCFFSFDWCFIIVMEKKRDGCICI